MSELHQTTMPSSSPAKGLGVHKFIVGFFPFQNSQKLKHRCTWKMTFPGPVDFWCTVAVMSPSSFELTLQTRWGKSGIKHSQMPQQITWMAFPSLIDPTVPVSKASKCGVSNKANFLQPFQVTYCSRFFYLPESEGKNLALLRSLGVHYWLHRATITPHP